MAIGSLQFFDLIWVMTEGGPIDASQTMATYMYKYSFQRFADRIRRGAFLVIFVICFGFALLYQRFVHEAGLRRRSGLRQRQERTVIED